MHPTHPLGKVSNILLIIAAIAIVMFSLLHHMSGPLGVSDSKPRSRGQGQHDEFKTLIKQTTQLLADIAASNVTLSPIALRDIQVLTSEEQKASEENAHLQQTISSLEKGLRHCHVQASADKDVANKLSSELVAMQKQHQTECITPSSSTSTSSRTTAATGKKKRWLIIGIPTVARRNHEDYLLIALRSLAVQLPQDPSDLMYGQVLVHVVNMQADADPSRKHIIFEQAKAQFGPGTAYSHSFLFSEQQAKEVTVDPIPGKNAANDQGNANHPGFLVRRQTRDIVHVMRHSAGLAEYYLFLEDDMRFCGQAMLAWQYLLSKANRYHPNWLAIRASYGMNGVFLRDHDILPFAEYLTKHQARRPPDHLVVEWYAGETPESKQYKGQRANVAFKYNLFDHLGSVSTLRRQPQGTFPRCYEVLLEPTLFQVEAFNPRQCPHDDIWPCPKGVHKGVTIDWSAVGS